MKKVGFLGGHQKKNSKTPHRKHQNPTPSENSILFFLSHEHSPEKRKRSASLNKKFHVTVYQRNETHKKNRNTHPPNKSLPIHHHKLSFNKHNPEKKKDYTSTWNSKQPVLYGCSGWMIPNLYLGNGCFTKHL